MIDPMIAGTFFFLQKKTEGKKERIYTTKKGNLYPKIGGIVDCRNHQGVD